MRTQPYNSSGGKAMNPELIIRHYSYFQVNRPGCRGTAPVRLLYIPEDCGCRAPTLDLWFKCMKTAVN